MIQSFDPITAPAPRILILGSMPGVESLRQQQYYAYPRNAFWRILFQIYSEPFSEDYDDRRELVVSRQLALWDVLSDCRRKGSLDSAIRDEVPNDFEGFFRDHPSIERICFNGGKAFQSYRRWVGFEAVEGIDYRRLPSTSPAHAIPYQDKYRAWSEALWLPPE